MAPAHISKQKIVVVLGPTATGKSDLGVMLARQFNGEIISADSRQAYRGLDIGSGKITPEEMQDVPHHMLDVASPRTRYTAAHYGKEGLKAIKRIIENGNTPFVVGGTGLYIDTLVCGTLFPAVPPNKKLRAELDKKTTEQLVALLKKKDPQRAAVIDTHNRPRLIRALEIVDALGSVPALESQEPAFDVLFIGLNLHIDELRAKIHTRLAKRMKSGMLDEIKTLRAQGVTWKRLDELGLEYRYLARHLKGKLSREDMFTQLEQEIVRYAKRQMTWFKRNKDIHWFTPGDDAKIEKLVKSFLKS